MKKNYLILFSVAVSLMMTSCASVYNFVQVLNTEPTAKSPMTKVNGGLLFEDETCAIFYSFWSEGGDASFEFYNKSNEIVFVDLEKSFLIVNGVALNYFGNRTWTESKSSNVLSSTTYYAGQSASATRSASISQYYAGNFGTLPTSSYAPIASSASLSGSATASTNGGAAQSTSVALGKSSGVEIREANIIAIPPHASKFIGDYSLASKILVNCERELYPADSASTSYTLDNSPLVFSNYITYKVGENGVAQTIENEFYVASVTNYAKPSIITYVEREKECENAVTMDNRYLLNITNKLYDAYVTIPTTGSFYVTYKVLTNKRLYKDPNRKYIWNNNYKAYIKGQ